MQFSDKLTNIFRNVADKASLAVATLATAAPVAAAAVIGYQSGIGNGALALTTSVFFAAASAIASDGLKKGEPIDFMITPLGPGIAAAISTGFLMDGVMPTPDPAVASALTTAVVGALLTPPLWHIRNALRLER